jgi:hypothetical protein
MDQFSKFTPVQKPLSRLPWCLPIPSLETATMTNLCPSHTCDHYWQPCKGDTTPFYREGN